MATHSANSVIVGSSAFFATAVRDTTITAANIVSITDLLATGSIRTAHSASASIDGTSTFGATGKGSNALSLGEVVDEILMLWGIESKDSAKEHIRQQAVNEINASMQFVSSQAKGLDYLGRTTRTYALSQNTSAVALEADVQNVIGPVRWSRPAVAVEIIKNTSPYCWIVDLGRLERGNFTLTLNVDGVATAFTANVQEPDGTDPFARHYLTNSKTPGDYTNNTGRLDQSLDIPSMLSRFEGNSNVDKGDIFITGKWPRYKIELTHSGSCSLAVSNITSATLRSEDTPLRPLSTRGQLESWRQTTGAYQTGRPEYYFISRTKSANADSTSISLEVRPHPDLGVGEAVGSLSVDVAVEPSRFEWADVAAGKPVSIPHAYVESLFLPIVRYKAIGNQYYAGTQETSASIQAGYQSALAQYGMVDPQIKEAEEAVVA